MQRIQTRTELIQFAQDNCKSYSCKRAFLTGKVAVLGGFDPIPPGTAPGWILVVLSVHGRKWILAVVTDDVGHCYHVRQLDKIPWANWGGSDRHRQIYLIKDGDVPRQAHTACLNATRRDHE